MDNFMGFFSFFLLLLHSWELSVLPFDLSKHLKNVAREQRKFFSFFLFILFLLEKKIVLLLRPCFPRGSLPGLVSVSRTPHHSHKLLCVRSGRLDHEGTQLSARWGMSFVFLFIVKLLRCSASVEHSSFSALQSGLIKSVWKPGFPSIIQLCKGNRSHKQVKKPQLFLC